jgi:hypothetical protein
MHLDRVDPKLSGAAGGGGEGASKTPNFSNGRFASRRSGRRRGSSASPHS